MARLPTVQSFGPRPIPRPSGNIVSIRGGVVEDAQARLQLGTADQFGRVGQQVTSTVDTIVQGLDKQAYSTARAAFLKEKIERDTLAANDQDFETKQATYEQDIDRLIAKHGESLPGRLRNTFNQAAGIDRAQGVRTVSTSAFTLRKDHNRAELADSLENLRNGYLQTALDDRGTRASIQETASIAIDALKEQGFLSASETQKLKSDFLVDSATAYISMQPGHLQHEMLQIPEGWSVGDELPKRVNDQTMADFIPEDVRVNLARAAMPGVNARVAIETADRIGAEGGSIESQLAKAGQISNPIVRDDVERRLKSDFAFQKARETELLIGASQARADQIRNSDLGPRGQIEAAKAIEDPELRDATLQRVRLGISEEEALSDAEDQITTDNIWADVVTGERTTDDLTAEQRIIVGAKGLTAMDAYTRTLKAGVEPVQDWPTWSAIQGLSNSELAAMSTSDFHIQFRNKLDDQFFAAGLNMLRAAKDGKAPEVSYVQTDAVVRQIVAAQNLSESNKFDRVKIDRLNRFASTFVEQHFAETGKQATRTEISQALNELFLPGRVDVSEKPGFQFFLDRPRDQIDVQGRSDEEFFKLDLDRLEELSTATGVPPVDIPAVIEILREEGFDVTPENIRRAAEFLE